MTKILRTRRTDMIEHIKDLIILNDDRLKGPFLEMLHQNMINRPDSIFFLVALDVEADELVGYLIAQDPGPQIPYSVLMQVWTTPSDHSIGEQLFSRLVLWSLSQGKDYINAETTRAVEPIIRKYDFQPVSQNIRFKITEQLNDMLHERASEAIQWEASSNLT